MPGALDGLRVVDFGHYIAGPLLSQLLADNGADVVHVDPPGGPHLSGLADAYLNRGKKRITLDLRAAGDRSTAGDLANATDVLVENFRPGVMDRLGLGADTIRAQNPRLVYCSLPGFASDDPRAHIQAWEGVVMSATAGYRRLHEHWDWKARLHAVPDDPGRPLFTAVPIASNLAALHGALGVMMALLQRDRTGSGTRLEVPLAESMLEAIGFHLEMPDFVGRRDNVVRPGVGSFRCADGRFIDHVPYPRFLEQFLTAAGVWNQWRDAGLSDLLKVFADPALKLDADQRFGELISTRPAEHWEGIALKLGIPMAQIRSPDEWLDHPHARASGMIVDVTDPQYGTISTAGSVMQFGLGEPRVAARSMPDADRAEVLASLRPSRPTRPRVAVDTDVQLEPPLSGVSVIEFGQMVAGPIAGRLLADYGADVLKVVNPAPTGNNAFHGSYTNRGKRSVLLDVQNDADRAALWTAVQRSDILLQNYAHDAMVRYGLGPDHVRAVNPSLVYVTLGAFTGQGPWQARRGHENQAVGTTGLSTRYGGAGQWPIYQPYLICDVGAGITGALAAALGLYQRNREGRVHPVATSLAHLATLHQGLYLFRGPQDARLPEPSGLNARGWTPLHQLYPAADGWMFLAAHPDQLPQLCRAIGIDDPRDTTLENVITDALRTRTRSEWIKRLAEDGITAQPVRELDEVAHDPTWHTRGVLRYHRNGEGIDDAPVLGAQNRPWPLPTGSISHPGTLGGHTAAFRRATTTSEKHRTADATSHQSRFEPSEEAHRAQN
jgi:crotonobetainyl-CoA:carnitine CoA-transferase CaiB-like acyl-CoA transferase